MRKIHCIEELDEYDLPEPTDEEISDNSVTEEMRPMKAKFNGREIGDIEIDGINHRDSPDYCDAFVSSAVWGDTLEDLNDAELDELNENSDLVYELVMERIY